MKQALLLSFCLLSLRAGANMASPWEYGTMPASPFLNHHVSIFHEHIHMRPDAGFNQVRYDVEYHIEVDTTGTMVPMLFYSPEFLEDFSVHLDSRELALESVPEDYARLEGTALEDFTDLFRRDTGTSLLHLEFDDELYGEMYLTTSDLQFFSMPLTRGRHVIRVTYTADPFRDDSDWVRAFSFRYALSPAALWKSFGDLEITLDASDCAVPIRTNLGPPAEGDVATVANWKFSALPASTIVLHAQPRPSWLARTLIALHPRGIALLLGIIMMLFHLRAMWNYRLEFIRPKLSWVAIVGGLVIPAVALLVYMVSFPFIDWVIGPTASGRHGYVFLVVALYPVIAPLYAIAMSLVDWWMRRRLEEPSEGK